MRVHDTYVTQHRKGILVGDMVIGSKSYFKGVVDKDVKIRPISLETWTKVEFSGQNDDNNRKIKDSMTIASWDISDGMFLNLKC